MGNSPARQAVEDFTRAIRIGEVTSVEAFLHRVAAARGSLATGDKLAQELRTLDLNKPLPEGLTPLQLAASCGRVEVVRCLLDTCRSDAQLPDLDPNVVDTRRGTALHLAAGFVSPPNCAQCVADMMLRRADPCVADHSGRTPLDVARAARCPHCVRTIEDRLKVWQGWVDHDEHALLQLPNWRTRWLVVCQDRYPNTGPWREASSVSVSCYQCHTVMRAPAYTYRLRCSCCSAEVAVTASLQLALYDEPRPGATLPSAPVPSVRLQLPMSSTQISVRALEDAGLRSFAGALLEGKLRRALQSTGGTSRVHGFTVKMLRASGALVCEHSVRVATPAERDRLMEVLRDPARTAYEAACSQAPASAPQALAAGPAAVPAAPPSPASGGAVPWNCSRCTYTHAEAEAALTRCAVCGTERGPAASPRAPGPADGFDDLPAPSAPPLIEDGPAPAAAWAALAGEASAPGGEAASAPPLPASAAAGSAASAGPAAPAPPAPLGGEGADGEDDGTCAICMERPADTAVVPCGHMCGCFACLQALHGAQGAQCPICRGPVASTIRIYRS
uniref:RING-type domain-containing protein n=1 Tax=Alexandrium monilatum TaxID=311494 RepID=A0A7S4SA61_9DINO